MYKLIPLLLVSIISLSPSPSGGATFPTPGTHLSFMQLEQESLAFAALPGGTFAVAAVDDGKIKSIKYSGGYSLSTTAVKFSVSSPYLVEQASSDLRWLAVLNATVPITVTWSDGTNSYAMTPVAVGTGETVGTNLGNDFTNWSGAVPTGWNQNGTPDASDYTEQAPAGSMHIVSNGGLIGIRTDVSGPATVGKLYRHSIDISALTGGALNSGDNSTGFVNFTTTGTGQVKYSTATTTQITLKRQATAVDATLDNWKYESVDTPDTTGFTFTDGIGASFNSNAASFTATIVRK